MGVIDDHLSSMVRQQLEGGKQIGGTVGGLHLV